MAVTSINVSRVSHNLQTISLLDSLRSNTLSLYMEQNRLASGSKFNTPSEDPVAAFRAMQLTEVLEQQDQILQNISHADSVLAATDTAIGEVSSLLLDAHDIALTMINGTYGADERQAEAQLILGIIDQLVTVGNRQYRDMYLFGGQQTETTPFTQDYGVAEYRGDCADLLARVDVNQEPAINLTGADLFGALTGMVQGFADLNPGIETDTRLVDMGGTTGRGIAKGMLQIALTAPAVGFTVDLSQADTAGDVIDMINAAAEQAGLTVGVGQDFNATFNADRDGFQINVTAGTATVRDLNDGATARDLGLLGTGTPLIGDDVDVKMTSMTRIDSLFAGAGAVLGTIHIENGHLAADVDLAGAQTIQEVVNRLNAAGVEVRASINDDATGLNVVNLVSGFEMKIGEAGDDTASILGIRSYYADTLLSQLNQGRGVQILEGKDDLNIQAKDGTVFGVNLDGCQTIQDVLDVINTSAASVGVAVSADLATTGNGIRIIDATGGADDLVVSRANMSYAIDALGLDQSTTGSEIISDDTNGIVPDSIFTVLHDLYEGLMHDDDTAISLAAQKLEPFMQQISRLQGEVGARSKTMTTRLQFTEDAVVSTQALLSEVKDLDYTEAVTRFQQAQTALEANLMTGSRLLQISLLDFLG